MNQSPKNTKAISKYSNSNLVKRGLEIIDSLDLLELDVTPLTLCYESEDGLAIPIFNRNTSIPNERTISLNLKRNSLSKIQFKIFTGEEKIANRNHLFAIYQIESSYPKHEDNQLINLTFIIDRNGILQAFAKDCQTQKQLSIKIIYGSGGLSDNEVDEMLF